MPDGTCDISLEGTREQACEQAIERMAKALKETNDTNEITKCDFCKGLSPNGRCNIQLAGTREGECRKAVERMTDVIETIRRKGKHKLSKYFPFR